MPRKYPFYPAYDGKQASPVTQWFAGAMGRRWGFKNLGIYANRPMRSGKGLSVHATGWAVDCGHSDRKVIVAAWNWLVENSETLRICEIHDYGFRNPKQDPQDRTAWGRGYRCSRGPRQRGVKLFTARDNAGTPGAAWLHVELDPTWTVEGFTAAWRSIPKP